MAGRRGTAFNGKISLFGQQYERYRLDSVSEMRESRDSYLCRETLPEPSETKMTPVIDGTEKAPANNTD